MPHLLADDRHFKIVLLLVGVAHWTARVIVGGIVLLGVLAIFSGIGDSGVVLAWVVDLAAVECTAWSYRKVLVEARAHVLRTGQPFNLFQSRTVLLCAAAFLTAVIIPTLLWTRVFLGQ